MTSALHDDFDFNGLRNLAPRRRRADCGRPRGLKPAPRAPEPAPEPPGTRDARFQELDRLIAEQEAHARKSGRSPDADADDEAGA